MFQFAFGCARGNVGDEVYFDVINGFAHDPFCRAYALEDFELDVQKAHASDIPLGMNWRPPMHLVSKAAWKAHPKQCRQVYYEKFPFDYEPEAIDPSNPSRYYWGYWQNPAYIEPISNALRKLLQLRCKTPSFIQLREEIAGRQSLSIHVRRYRDLDKRGKVITTTAQNHGICDTSFYQQALMAVPEHAYHHVYIFSDDPKWCKMNLRLPVRSSYVTDCGAFSAAEELMLMAACKNHVISNSSFSWWGAWLGRNPRKTIVAPIVWNKSQTGDQATVCPSTWIRL